MDRFSSKHVPVTETGCWLWEAGVDNDGYGHYWKDGTTKKAHRVAYEVYKGPIPDGLFVCHTCDVSSCVNPDHLFLGTALDNNRDKMSKGRFVNGRRKLTAHDIVEIKERYAAGETQTALAKEYGVVHSTIGKHIRGTANPPED